MEHSPDRTRAALLLTNRLVQVDAKPFTAREFWDLVARVDVGELLHRGPPGIAELAGVSADDARRIRVLLDAATALGFEQERLEEAGVTLLSALDEPFPVELRRRLRTGCPPFLLVGGPVALLGGRGLGIVGSRDAGDGSLAVAGDAARVAVEHGWPVVSGLARGVDRTAITAAIEAGGPAVGVPAEGIHHAARDGEVRRWVHDGRLCIASPYPPAEPFRAGNAIGRNKIIYALSWLTVVVSADEGAGGSWSGAIEALDERYAPVAVWAGPGARDGNVALARRGAIAITDVRQLSDIDPVDPGDPVDRVPPRQGSLF